MMNDLPISPKKKFKYSITFQSFNEESLEAGDSLDNGYEIEHTVDLIGDILYEANTTYGIYMPVSFGTWESTEPEQDRDFFEKGISKYYALHLTNEDGTEISQEESDFISFLLSDGRYEIDKFRDYAVGGLVLGAIALGVGTLITYFYFKNKKPSVNKVQKPSANKVVKTSANKFIKPSLKGRSKSVIHNINGKKRKFPIKDAWRKEHSTENKSENYEVPQEDRFEMGGDASEHYHEIEYGEGGVARAKDVIMNKIGFNEEVADYFVSKSEKFSIWLADAVLKTELKHKNYNKIQFLESTYSSVRHINMVYGNDIREILDWLQHPLTPKQNLKELSFDQAIAKAKEWHDELQVLGGDIDFTEPETNQILKKYPVNSDGIEYYWVYIDSNYCDLESSRMGHCGRTGYGNTLISLRSVKPYGKGHTISDSHVTIAYGVNDGMFYQVKGKKNNKPAEKYFPYIFDLIKTMLTDEEIKHKFNEDDSFTGFGNEYQSSEDYGFEDMSKEQIREVYDLKPTLFESAEDNYMLLDAGVITLDEFKEIVEREPDTFSSFGNQMKLYERGIITEQPSTSFELNYDCDDVYRLLEIDRDFSDDLVAKLLCGDFEELYDGFGHYYDNPSDLVSNLNKENEQRVIDEIVRITELDESVVKENGIEHYLSNEDDDFPNDNFDNIIHTLASAQNQADNNDYYKYLYGAIESALNELGTVHSLNDEGVKMTIELSNNMSFDEIAEGMDYYEFSDVEDLFNEKIGEDFDKPRLSIDDRYSPYGSSEDFNDYVSEDLERGYKKGGYLGEKNINKNMKTIQTKLKAGGDLGYSKEDYFLVVKNWVYFTFNYPMGFVKDAFGSSSISTHLQEKFSSSYERFGSYGVLISFWGNLDANNREILSLWIKNNYLSFNEGKTELQSISDDNYAKIITHWNMFCYNFDNNFVEKVFEDNSEHFENKWVRSYERAGSTGAVNKFFTELSGNNQRLLTDWVYDNHKHTRFAEGGEADKNAHLTNGQKNKMYLDDLSTRNAIFLSNKLILENISKNYGGIGIKRVENEIYDNDAEMLYEYIANDDDLRIRVYGEMEFMFRKDKKFADGGRVTTNDGIIEAFLTSNKQLKVGNLSTHFNEYDNEMLLRNYGTLIATRKGNDVSITNTKYSKTTTIITNKVNSMALNKGMNVNNTDKFEKGGVAEISSSDLRKKLGTNDKIVSGKEYINNGEKYIITWDENDLVLKRFIKADEFIGGKGDRYVIDAIIPRYADGGEANNTFNYYDGAGARTVYELSVPELETQLKITKPNETERIDVIKKLIEQKSNKFADGGEAGLKEGVYNVNRYTLTLKKESGDNWKVTIYDNIKKATKIDKVLPQNLAFLESLKIGKVFADGGGVDYSVFDKPQYLDSEDFKKISREIERLDMEKHRKLGTHKKFTEWWYNGGQEVAMKKYGNDVDVAWTEAYEDFKDKFADGGKAGDKSVKRPIRKKRQPKVARTQFEEQTYEYAEGGGIGIGRYSILAELSDSEEPRVYKRVNNRNEIAGMVDKVEVAMKQLGYNDVRIFVTDEKTDDEVYNYAEGGSVKGIKKKAEKLLEDSINYRFKRTDMGSGWLFQLESPLNKNVFNLLEEQLYLDEFSPDDMGIEDYDDLSKEEQDYYYEDWKEELFQSSFEAFKEKCKKHLDDFIEYIQQAKEYQDEMNEYAEGGETYSISEFSIYAELDGEVRFFRNPKEDTGKGNKKEYAISIMIDGKKQKYYDDYYFDTEKKANLWVDKLNKLQEQTMTKENKQLVKDWFVENDDRISELITDALSDVELIDFRGYVKSQKKKKFAEGGSLNDYIDEQVDEFDDDENKMREQYRGDVRDIEYQGFLAIDTSLTPNERLSDYEFDGEEFDRDNLLEVAKKYPQAEYITFHARIMGENEWGQTDEGYTPIDDLAMSFDMDKLNQYADGGKAGDKSVKRPIRKKRQPKVARTQFEEETYEYKKGGEADSYKFFDVYDKKTDKTLKIKAESLADAKIYAEESIDFNEYEDGEKINLFDWFWNHDYRHYLRDASPKQRNIIKQKFIEKGLELDGSSPKHAYIVVSIINPSELTSFKKVGSDGIKFADGGEMNDDDDNDDDEDDDENDEDEYAEGGETYSISEFSIYAELDGEVRFFRNPKEDTGKGNKKEYAISIMIDGKKQKYYDDYYFDTEKKANLWVDKLNKLQEQTMTKENKQLVKDWFVENDDRISELITDALSDVELIDFRGYVKSQKKKKYAKGGMIKHGLRIGDEITFERTHTNKIGIIDHLGEKHTVDLDKGKRYAEGGGLKEIDDTNYKQYVVRYEYYNGKIGERYFDNYSDAIKSYDESVDNEKDGGSSTIYLEGYTGEEDGYVLMRYFDPREIKDEDEYAGGGRIDKMDKFISELAKKNTKEFSVNEYHDFRNKKYAIGVARYYFTDNDGSFSKFDTKLGDALNIDFETQGDSKKYAEGGEADSYKFFDVYDKKTDKTLKIKAESLADAKIYAEESIDFNEYKDGEKINLFDWFWNYDYRHYLRDASPKQRNIVKQKFIKKGLELNGSSPKHAYIVVSTINPSELTSFKKVGSDGIKFAEGGETGDDENFEYWIYQNYPTFDIDTFHLQEFLEEHYEDSLTYNENFKNLQEWLDDDSENDEDEYAEGGKAGEFEVYDEETGKTLIILAHSNEEAEGISETIDFNDYEDGDLINVLDDIANYEDDNDDDNYAKGGKAGEKSTKNTGTKKRPKTRQPKMVRQYFEDSPYSYEEGGKIDYSLIGKDVIITNSNDENGNYDKIGKIVSVIEPSKSQLSSGYSMINYVINFPMNNEDTSYLREEFEINSKNYADGGSTELHSELIGISISHATLKTEHLISAFMDFLNSKKSELNNEIVNRINKIQSEINTLEIDEDGDYIGESEEIAVSILNEDIFDLMNDIAPDGTYFGSTEGDGSDFGFWLIEEDEDEYAEGGEVEDWMEEALASLIEETGNESLDITMVSNSGNEFFAGNDNEEYRVFKSEDDAELTAEDEVREMLEESPENFNFEFLMNNVYANDFLTEELKKMNYSYVEDIASESDKKYTNRLIAEMVENGLLDEDDAKSGNAEELADDLKSVYVDLLTEEQLEGGSIDFDYFINNYGEEETLKMFIENNVIDIDEASKDAVQTYGIAHFLSSYDGETLYLSDGYVAYRNN